MQGLSRDERHFYRWNEGPKVPGVTSVIKSLDKSGPLVGWAKRETAASAVRNLTMLASMVRDGGPDSAAKWLSSIPDYQRDTSADLGTRIHILAEGIVRGQRVEVTPEEAPYIESYVTLRQRLEIRDVNAEYMVYSERHQYGGTADLAAWIGDELYLLDIKTGKAAYAETALQLAGLHGADWAGREGDPKKYRLPAATRFGVLHIRPDGAELIPYQVGADEFGAFLACRQLTRWLAERAPFVKSVTEKGVLAA